MSQGIVYLFVGTIGYAERIAVSLFTLRQHYDGPILLMLDENTKKIGRRIASDNRIQADCMMVEPYTGYRHSNFVTKALTTEWTPFDQTLLLDGDTTIHGNLDRLFDFDLSITQFADWQSQGNLISGRLRKWEGRSPEIDELLRRQLGCRWPAINTGIVGFRKNSSQARAWRELTIAGAGTHWTDELAMQLLTGAMASDQYKLLDDSWNCSPIYGINKENPKVWHYHGRKHLRREQGRKLWEPIFRKALAANVGGIKEWAGHGDKWVRELLEGKL